MEKRGSTPFGGRGDRKSGGRRFGGVDGLGMSKTYISQRLTTLRRFFEEMETDEMEALQEEQSL